MSLDVDGSAILRAIADTPAVFGIDRARVDGLALSVVLARLKDKLATIADLRQLHGTIGGASLGMAVEQMKDTELAALVKRLDPHHPDLKTSDRQWQRARADAVLGGAEPMQAAQRQGRAKVPAKAPAKAQAVKPKTGVAGRSEALKAAREAAASAPRAMPPEDAQPPALPKVPRKRTPKAKA